jgi:cytochrome c
MRKRLVLASPALALTVAALTLTRPAIAATELAGDPAAGHEIYKSVCSLCHSDQKGVIKIGPPLYGAFGRKAGTFPGFHYSDAVKNSGKTWDVPTLQVWEAGARKDIPGTKMSFPGLKTDKQINDMIAYLQTLHD